MNVLIRSGRHAGIRRQRGVALIIVMMFLVVLGILAGKFAYSMKVEAKLARNASSEVELQWMGRSGVEYARWILGQPKKEPFDSLNQIWAGGPGSMDDTNSPLADVRLDQPIEFGNGKFTVKITDLERKVNLNLARNPAQGESMLQQAFTIMGVDAAETSGLTSSILDWIDQDDAIRVGGAEKEYYQGLEPPYNAKNGPVDEMSELLLVKGITPELLWGAGGSGVENPGHRIAAFQAKQHGRSGFGEGRGYTVGLADLFCTMSLGKINVNTASASVLQMVPAINESMAAEIIKLRAGMDGVDGTEDDVPFRSVSQMAHAGLPQQAQGMLAQMCDIRSATFEVVVNAEVNGYSRQFVSVLRRNAPKDVQMLTFTWR